MTVAPDARARGEERGRTCPKRGRGTFRRPYPLLTDSFILGSVGEIGRYCCSITTIAPIISLRSLKNPKRRPAGRDIHDRQSHCALCGAGLEAFALVLLLCASDSEVCRDRLRSLVGRSRQAGLSGRRP